MNRITKMLLRNEHLMAFSLVVQVSASSELKNNISVADVNVSFAVMDCFR